MAHGQWILFTIISTLLIPTYPQSIQIHDITDNAGALFLKKGEGRVIAGFDRLLHIIDFREFEISISILENLISQTKNSTSNLSEIIQMKLREIKFIYSTLNLKSHRHKRAIEALGSTIKFITGNLDAEDMKIINSNLDEMRKTGNSIIKQNNRQIRINSKFENRLNLVNKEIKNNQNIINNILKNNNYILSEHQEISIAFQLDTFLENLKAIEYAIMLAKLNIISKFVLTPKEIEIIIKEITDQGLKIQHLDDATSYLSTTTLHKDSSTIICVNIPRLQPTSYEKVIIEPLHVHNHSVKLTHNTVFINPEQILAVTSECREANKITICERRQLIDISNSTCEAPLLRGLHGQCPVLEKPPSTHTKTIDSGTLLVQTVHQDVIINGTCGIEPRTLKGIHLITFHNCSLYIKNELFENYELRFEQPSILPLQLTKIETLHIERHINLSELHELHMKNRQHLESMDFKYRIGSIAFSTVITLIIVLLAIGFVKYCNFTKTGNCSGRAILAEGLVKQVTTSPTIADIEESPHACTGTTQSALSQTNDSHMEELDIGTSSTLSNARLAVLGIKAGQFDVAKNSINSF